VCIRGRPPARGFKHVGTTDMAMDLKKFVEQADGKVVGPPTHPHVQRKTGGKIYFDVPVNERTVQSLGLENGDMIHVLIRNMEGECVDVKRKVSGASSGRLKFYLPRGEAEDLGLEEGDLLDVFITKLE
jgi:hypothetical protein